MISIHTLLRNADNDCGRFHGIRSSSLVAHTHRIIIQSNDDAQHLFLIVLCFGISHPVNSYEILNGINVELPALDETKHEKSLFPSNDTVTSFF